MRKESRLPFAEQCSQYGRKNPSPSPRGQERVKPDGDKSRTADVTFSVSLPSKTTIEQVLR
jgi:hypothetical protein